MTQEDDQSTVIKTIFKDLTNLQNAIKETQLIEEQFDKNDITIDNCIDSTKKIVTTLKESVDKIYEVFNNNYTIWQKKNVDEIEPLSIKPEPTNEIGKIKLVDLSKLIDPGHKSKLEKQKLLETSVFTISDSDSEEAAPPPPRQTRKRNINNNTSDDENISSKSILKTRNNGQDKYSKSKSSTKKVQFTDKDKIILNKLTCSDSSRSSDSSDSDDEWAKNRSRRRGKKSSNKTVVSDYKIPAKLDAKFKRKCYVKIAHVDLFKMKRQYMLQLDNEKIKRLTNLKSLKRSRKTVSDSDSSDSNKSKAKRRAITKKTDKKSKRVDSSSDNNDISDKSDTDNTIEKTAELEKDPLIDALMDVDTSAVDTQAIQNSQDESILAEIGSLHEHTDNEDDKEKDKSDDKEASDKAKKKDTKKGNKEEVDKTSDQQKEKDVSDDTNDKITQNGELDKDEQNEKSDDKVASDETNHIITQNGDVVEKDEQNKQLADKDPSDNTKQIDAQKSDDDKVPDKQNEKSDDKIASDETNDIIKQNGDVENDEQDAVQSTDKEDDSTKKSSEKADSTKDGSTKEDSAKEDSNDSDKDTHKLKKHKVKSYSTEEKKSKKKHDSDNSDSEDERKKKSKKKTNSDNSDSEDEHKKKSKKKTNSDNSDSEDERIKKSKKKSNSDNSDSEDEGKKKSKKKTDSDNSDSEDESKKKSKKNDSDSAESGDERKKKTSKKNKKETVSSDSEDDSKKKTYKSKETVSSDSDSNSEKKSSKKKKDANVSDTDDDSEKKSSKNAKECSDSEDDSDKKSRKKNKEGVSSDSDDSTKKSSKKNKDSDSENDTKKKTSKNNKDSDSDEDSKKKSSKKEKDESDSDDPKKTNCDESDDSDFNKKKKSNKKDSDDDSDSDRDKKKSKKSKKKSSDTDSSDSDKKKKKRKKSAKNSSDDDQDENSSDDEKSDKKITHKSSRSSSQTGKLKLKIRRRFKKRNKRVISDSDGSGNDKKESSSDSDKKSSSTDSEEERKKAEEKKKNKKSRIKRTKDSSSDEEDKSTRKQIRKVLNRDSLAESTKLAEKEESERKARILDRQKKYNDIFEADKLEKSSLTKVVLDFNEETEEELLRVSKSIVKHLKPHQGKGIQFMWDASFESIERAKTTPGSGCILAHCMGLGKSLQVVALSHTLIKHSEKTGVKKILVVCPLSTVLNWVNEYKKWLPDDDEVVVMDLVQFKQMRGRIEQILQWHKYGGVLVMGYDMYRNLSNENNKRMTKKMRADFQMSLVKPGPDLVVCDEGHLLKNEKTSLSIAMNRIETLRRIVLTGTPLQNNLKEYWCMVQFVKPNLLGTYKEYLNRFVNPITNGQYTDSTDHDIQIMRKRSHVLHKLLDGIVQRRDYAVLAPFLPPKYEYVLFVNLTETQINLYSYYMKEFARKSTGTKSSFLFVDFQELARICTHPRVLLDKSIQNRIAQEKKDWENEEEESEGSIKDFIDDGDDVDTTPNNSSSSDDEKSDKSDKSVSDKPKQNKFRRRTRGMKEVDGKELSDIEEVVPDEPSEWWRQFTKNDELDNIVYSGKLHLLFEILHQCEAMGDKVLVFSQSLYSLNIIEYFLSKIDEANQNNDSKLVGGYSSSWALGLDYFRLDGSSSCDNRALWCNYFNDPENVRARLFLISTRAGGLGINLVAANRVVIFDVSWNPSHDIQSIYRVYRFGQTKPSYIYRFVTLGSMEMKIYERQVTKQAISKRVIDEQQIDRHYNQNDLAELYRFEPKPAEERPIPMVPKDILLGELLQNHENLIYKYHEHQSLLENKEDEVLDEAERKAAWEEFENEKKNRQSGLVMNPFAGVGGLSMANIPIDVTVKCLTNIIKREHPAFTAAEISGVMPQLIQELNGQLAAGETTMYTKLIAELKSLQTQHQQQKLQEYYAMQQQQHQLKLLQKYQQQLQQSGISQQDMARIMQQQWPSNQKAGNSQRSVPPQQNLPQPAPDPNEVVSIDD